MVDNLGNIVQEVAGGASGAAGGLVSTIVGNYQNNMTFTGVTQTLQNGLVQKQYSYAPLNTLVNIVFNAAGQVVQATVDKSGAGSGGNSTTTAKPGSSSIPLATTAATAAAT